MTGKISNGVGGSTPVIIKLDTENGTTAAHRELQANQPRWVYFQ